MPLKKAALACTTCGLRNYSINTNNHTKRLEIKKFCKHCAQHTMHKETK
ncbi:MAG: 50S ribosomal protein L33 [Streptococcaceae bacterium]|nr:50S ribosomal protein L33 [Streptococcaceae bacterium]